MRRPGKPKLKTVAIDGQEWAPGACLAKKQPDRPKVGDKMAHCGHVADLKEFQVFDGVAGGEWFCSCRSCLDKFQLLSDGRTVSVVFKKENNARWTAELIERYFGKK